MHVFYQTITYDFACLFQCSTPQNSLIALAAVCLLREECRTQAINSKILPYAVGAMSSHNSAIRLAACQCIKSLSRSVRHLRTHLVDAGVISPLLKVNLGEFS